MVPMPIRQVTLALQGNPPYDSAVFVRLAPAVLSLTWHEWWITLGTSRAIARSREALRGWRERFGDL
jgi:hypothetical protein